MSNPAHSLLSLLLLLPTLAACALLKPGCGACLLLRPAPLVPWSGAIQSCLRRLCCQVGLSPRPGRVAGCSAALRSIWSTVGRIAPSVPYHLLCLGFGACGATRAGKSRSLYSWGSLLVEASTTCGTGDHLARCVGSGRKAGVTTHPWCAQTVACAVRDSEASLYPPALLRCVLAWEICCPCLSLRSS